MKKRMGLLSSLLAVSLLTAGLGTGFTSLAEETEADFSEPTTISFYSSETDAALDALTVLIEQFNEENEYNITVELTTPSDYETLLKTMMASNNLPDIFGTHGWAVRRYDEYLYDLSNESWAEYVSDSVRDIITDDDGKLCVLPIGQALEGIQFNVDVLDEYGIDPTELETWDSFVAALETIRDESEGEITPLYVAGSESAIIGFFTNSLSAVNIGGNEEANADALLSGDEFDWDYMAQVMDKFKELADDGLLNDGYLTAQTTDMIEAFATGKCAFIFLGTQVAESAADVNPDLNWGFMPYPAMTDLGATEAAFTNGEQGTYGVWKDSPNLEAALKALEYLAEPENVAYYCESCSKPAGLTNVDLDLGESNEWFDVFSDAKGVGQFDRTYLPNGCYDVMCDAQSKVLMGTIDSTEGAEMLQEEYDRLFGSDD